MIIRLSRGSPVFATQRKTGCEDFVLSPCKIIEDLLRKYKSGTCSIVQLLDFEHEDRVVPVYIIEQLSCNSKNYNTSETFTQNMQRILDCKDKFIFYQGQT